MQAQNLVKSNYHDWSTNQSASNIKLQDQNLKLNIDQQ